MTADTTPEAGMRLDPCPFCGGAGRLTFGTYELDAGNHVVCEGRKDCPMFCSTPYRVHDTRAEAIAAWNTRAAAPAGGEGEADGPPAIWLEPTCCAETHGDGRRWSEDPCWEECDGHPEQKPTKYVRADLAARARQGGPDHG